MEPQRIQRRRTKGWRMSPGTVYVGRPSRWGNPFKEDAVGGLARALKLYRNMVQGIWDPMDYAPERAEALERAYRLRNEWLSRMGRHPAEAIRAELHGKNLCCWCALSLACHADVLLELANPASTRGS